MENEATNEGYANLIVFNLIGKLTEPQASKFGFIMTVPTEGVNDIVMDEGSEPPTGPPAQRQNNNAHLGPRKFAIDFIETKKFDLQRVVDKFTPDDTTIMKIIKSKVEPLFMGTTFLLWEAIKKKDQSRQINAAIKKSYEPKIIEKVTEEVAMVIERLDLVNPPKSLDDYVNKLVEAKINKAKTAAKKTHRKNYGADAKNQTSAPTKNGQNSRKESSDRSPSSTSAAKPKKWKKKTAEPKTTSNKKECEEKLLGVG